VPILIIGSVLLGAYKIQFATHAASEAPVSNIKGSSGDFLRAVSSAVLDER
jgi:hypothetical protein